MTPRNRAAKVVSFLTAVNSLWQLLDEPPEETAAEISMVLLLTAEEAKKSLASLEFDDPIPSKL